MRTLRRAGLAALSSAVMLLNAAGAAQALANEPGGVAAPAAPQAGGSQFGVPASVARPSLSELRVPATAIAGPPPRITLELVESHVATVYLRVLIVDLRTRRPLVTATMGWVHTSRRLAVVWPAGARVAAGTYQVIVSSHDHRNGNILRNARISGFTTLTVKDAPAPPAPASPVAAPEAGVPTPAQTVADGAVFPVRGAHNFGGPENRFGAPRSGHIHQGQDVLTAEGTPDVAPLAGTIESTANQPGGAGYYVVEHTLIGFDFFFAHCQAGSFTVAAGQAVAAGRQICSAGQTGDATAPHLHFEIWVGGWQASGGHPIDPLPYLEAWERAGA
jgi:murein DD-endopeptidase MepM/ murein hydrolase activator NlpD